MTTVQLASIPSPDRNAIELGPLTVTFYGIAVALGILAAFLVASRRWEARGHNPDDLQKVGLWAVIAGLVGARVAYLLPRLDRYLEQPASIFAIWEGGLAIFGGLVGGVAVGYFVVRRLGLNLPDAFDAVAPALPLAQAIGRWGNYFNQELFGRPTDLPWGLEIAPENRPFEHAGAETFHPTFLYESLWNLGAVGFLLALDRRRVLGRGNLFLVYVLLYGAGRFWVELLRIDTDFRLLGLSRNNWFALGVAVAGVILLIVRERTARRTPAPEDSETTMAEEVRVGAATEGDAHEADAHGAETPQVPEQAPPPEADTPKPDTPGADTPGADTPGADTPGTETPGAERAETPGAEREPEDGRPHSQTGDHPRDDDIPPHPEHGDEADPDSGRND